MDDDSQKQEEASKDEQKPDKSVRNRRLRALILGTIAAGGAFQLNGWQAQAHGNRSTGSTPSIRATVTPGDVEVISAKPAEKTGVDLKKDE